MSGRCRRWIAAALALMLALWPLSAQGAEEVYDGLIRDPAPEAEQPSGEITVDSLLAACKEQTIAKKTELMGLLHDYFVSQMNVSACAQELENANKALVAAEADALMGLADSIALETARKNAERAQGLSDKAALEQLKVIAGVRGLTGVDITGAELEAEDAFLTLQPSQLTLGELKEAARGSLAQDADEEQVLLTLEQDFIDVSLTYAQIGTAAGEYREAAAAREEMALALVMGRASAEDFRAATSAMKQARLTLFSEMASYSKLLYEVNCTCGGLLARMAGKPAALMQN